ncbi:MAG: tetratricopeptide repeat protein [Candidatus Marinimicrobia bacterium]|jgi:tetratricopeptide (TPR) repeat protein|nr:tetratricopeptide repeat protein [Candidatus Neomarinimicrobiota bacterium]MBT3501138.1 tetratricopeptide repeat protein [Candidatus Neomarinimicrobiota bacterium]MBT3840438.1 tetratricopeptide repeat protein [Candidatus Neomarinimicrobiota bacterium]MBT4000004.1 tetratricopeptide repeat protein [Candidatus Neomarinimicrobiota bacterium]MBT4282375.1 tetratricopeptide repeat protein [Candidatus Neomarinimicrobiota bacterium]
MKKLLFSLLFVSALIAQFDQLFVGTRPLSMGGAFIAVADDANAITWNPAGLPGLRRTEFTTTYADLYAMGITQSYVGLVRPFSDRIALGFDWSNVGFDDKELLYAENKLNFALGYQPHKMFSLGFTLKYLMRDMQLDGTSYGKSSGIGYDAGILIQPLKNLKMGLGLYDLGGTQVAYKDKTSEVILGQAFKLGISYMPIDVLTLAADFGDRFHFGAEYIFANRISFRAGMQHDFSGSEKILVPSAGVSLKFKSIVVEYGYESHPYLESTHRMTFALQLSPAVVSITSTIINHNPIFRSLHRYYESEPFIKVGLKNISDADLPVNVSLYVPTMMDNPHSESITLPPKSEEEYEIGISFSSDILTSKKATFDNLVQPEVKVSYKQGGEEKIAQKKMESSYVLGKGKLTWSNPDMIACYVTPADPVVDKFARDFIQYYTPVLNSYFGRSNLGRGIILYDALGTHGLVYNIDLETPFLDIADDKTAFDTVKYPGDMLRDKIGDCDDLTTLYGSLMGNLGIETMFLDVFKPGAGHIFLMFDSGVKPDEVGKYFLDETEVVVLNDKVWIPIEATLVGKPFFSAWKQGAMKYNEMKEGNFVNEISVKEASAKYLAGSHITQDMPIPEIDGINDLLKEDIKQYGMWLEQIVYNSVGNKLEKAEDYYDGGVKYMEFGRYKEAIDMLETAINMKPFFPDAINTLGVCYTKKENFEKAIEFYEKALEQSGDHAGYMLNIAISHFMMGNKGVAKLKYNEVVLVDPVFAGKLDKVFGAAKASLGGSISQGPKLKISDDLEAELAEGSSQGLVEIKDVPKNIKPQDIEKVDYRKRSARGDNTIGITFARLGNYSMAVDYFKKSVLNDPENMDYKVDLAVALYRLFKYDEAIEYYDIVKRAKPELVSQLDFIESVGEITPNYKKFD